MVPLHSLTSINGCIMQLHLHNDSAVRCTRAINPRSSLRVFLIHETRFSVMDSKMLVWCPLRALFLCNSRHPCPWSYSSTFKQLRAIYSPHNLWKLKYQSLLIPTKSECKIQAVCLLFIRASQWKLKVRSHWVILGSYAGKSYNWRP